MKDGYKGVEGVDGICYKEAGDEVHFSIPLTEDEDVFSDYVMKVPAVLELLKHDFVLRQSDKGIDGETMASLEAFVRKNVHFIGEDGERLPISDKLCKANDKAKCSITKLMIGGVLPYLARLVGTLVDPKEGYAKISKK